jgi:squalene-associated FAD-dependent desaturase
MRAIVIGGGPAGIAAACTLVQAGIEVLLLERTPRLGGRAASFHHPPVKQEIDYGHHILMRCCTESIALLSQLGVEEAVSFQARLRVPIRAPGGVSVLTSTSLPGACHLLPSLLRYRHLRPSERLSAMRAVLSLLSNEAPAGEPFATFLTRCGQGERTIARLWDPISIATLNAHVEEVGASYLWKVFKDGFLQPHGADLGFFVRPLSRIFAAAIPFLRARGGTVQLKTPVARVLLEGGKATGVTLADGERLNADWIIAAVPPGDLLSLLPRPISEHEPFSLLRRLQYAPIVNLHLWFDHSVMEEPFFIAVDSQIQAVFDVSRIQEKEGPAHVVVSQSAAVEWVHLPIRVIQERLMSALITLVPGIKKARLVEALTIKRPFATFLPSPESGSLRPTPQTPIRGLLLAGDSTATGWPATLEGAVRSGHAAAKCILA